MDYLEWIPERLTQLRLEKGVSARDMSLSLGQSVSYINKIENRRTLPSVSGLLYICEYFGITPQEFFDTSALSPLAKRRLTEQMSRLSPGQAQHVLQIIDDILEK